MAKRNLLAMNKNGIEDTDPKTQFEKAKEIIIKDFDTHQTKQDIENIINKNKKININKNKSK